MSGLAGIQLWSVATLKCHQTSTTNLSLSQLLIRSLSHQTEANSWSLSHSLPLRRSSQKEATRLSQTPQMCLKSTSNLGYSPTLGSPPLRQSSNLSQLSLRLPTSTQMTIALAMSTLSRSRKDSKKQRRSSGKLTAMVGTTRVPPSWCQATTPSLSGSTQIRLVWMRSSTVMVPARR